MQNKNSIKAKVEVLINNTSTHFICGYAEMRQSHFVFVSTNAVLVRKIDK